jgi:hypothetical protein
MNSLIIIIFYKKDFSSLNDFFIYLLILKCIPTFLQ